MALDSAGCAQKLADAMNEVGNGTFSTDFAKAYNEYAKGGVILGAVNSGGDESLLVAALDAVTASPASVDVMAAGFAGFWATVGLVGDGAHGGAPISVVNDAAAKLPVFKSAITAAINATDSKPYYLDFISQVETAVLAIIWVVTEAMPPMATPTPFPETVK